MIIKLALNSTLFSFWFLGKKCNFKFFTSCMVNSNTQTFHVDVNAPENNVLNHQSRLCDRYIFIIFFIMHIESALLYYRKPTTSAIQSKPWLRFIETIGPISSPFQWKAVNGIRYVLNLLGQKPIVGLNYFKSLAEHGVKWLPFSCFYIIKLGNHSYKC